MIDSWAGLIHSVVYRRGLNRFWNPKSAPCKSHKALKTTRVTRRFWKTCSDVPVGPVGHGVQRAMAAGKRPGTNAPGTSRAQAVVTAFKPPGVTKHTLLRGRSPLR